MKKVYVCYKIITKTKLFRTSAHTNIHKQFNNAYYFYSDSKKSKSKVIFLTNFEINEINKGTFIVSIRKAKKSDVIMIFILKTSEQHPRIKKYCLHISDKISDKKKNGKVIYDDGVRFVIVERKRLYDILFEQVNELEERINEIDKIISQ